MFELEVIKPAQHNANQSFPIPEFDAEKLRLWKLMTSISSHLASEFPVLHPSRSNTLMILAKPVSMKMEELLTFIRFYSLTNKFKITIINYFLSTIIVQFDEQENADRFYMNALSIPFNVSQPCLKCIALFLAKVSSDVDLGINPVMTLEENTPRDFDLPICPICFMYFDHLISSFFGTIKSSDLSKEAFVQWGEPKCPACMSIFSQKTCSSCSESTKLWVCLECGHVGCGRDKNQHAVLHFEATKHRFALRYDNLWLWDYISDKSVVRTFDERSYENSEENENVISQYKKMVVDNITNIKKRETLKIEKITTDFKTEIQKLNNDLKALEEEEKDLEVYMEEYDKLEKESQEICGTVDQYKMLNTKITRLTKQLADYEKENEKLLYMVENAGDCSNDVIIEFKK